MYLPVVAECATCAKTIANLTGDLILIKSVTTNRYFGIFVIQGLPFIIKFSERLVRCLGDAP
jgi:hypothetical protein